MPLGRAVDDPDVVAGAPEVIAHLLKTRPAEEAGDGDVADDAGAVRGVVIEDLPRRPAPEVDVEIAQVLAVRARAPLARRHPLGKRRGFLRQFVFALNPAASPECVVFVGRIAEHDGDGLVAFDLVCRLPRLGDRREDAGNPALVVVRIAERIRDEHAHGFLGNGAGQLDDFGKDAKLRDRERTELHFESDEPFRRRVDRGRDGTFPFVRRDGLRDFAQHAEQEGAGAGGRIGEGDDGRREAGGELEAVGAQHVIDEADHGADDFRRRVIRAGELAEVVVVDFEEVFVEIEPRVGIALADFLPVHRVEHAGERAERGLERGLILGVVGEQTERGTDERVRFRQLGGDLLEASGKTNFFRPRHEQAEGDGLRVAIGEGFVVCFREEKFAPVGGERGEGFAAKFELLSDFIAQEPAKARADVSEVFRAARRDGFPAEEILEEREQARRCRERVTGCFDVAEERDDGIDQLAILPKAERVAVGVEDVRQRAQFFPLGLVVRIAELARVRAFARRFQFHKTDERVMNGDRVIRPRLQFAEG